MSDENAAVRLIEALEQRNRGAAATTMTRRVTMIHDSGDATGGIHHRRGAVTRALLAALDGVEAEVLSAREVNGQVGILARDSEERVVGVVAIGAHRGRIAAIWMCTAPGKLGDWRPSPAPPRAEPGDVRRPDLPGEGSPTSSSGGAEGRDADDRPAR